MGIQCVHEYAHIQCFVKNYWDAHWFQVRALPHAINLSSSRDVMSAPAVQMDVNPTVTAPGNVLVQTAASSVLEEDATAFAHTESTDHSVLEEDATALVHTGPTDCTGNDYAVLLMTTDDRTERPKKRHKVEYHTMMDTCTEICNIASKQEDTSEQVYGGLLAMLSIL